MSSYANTQRTTFKVVGPEAHVSGVFNYTMHKITNLGSEVERLRVINDNLAQKLENVGSQKQVLMAKNLELERDVLEVRSGNDELLKARDEAQKELQSLKHVLENVDKDWSERQKELQLEISNLKQAKKYIVEEKARERLVYAHQRTKLNKEIEAVTAGTKQHAPEVKKNQERIAVLQQKDSKSTRNMGAEINRFKQFLDHTKRY